jgi:hypothetical protein
MSANARSGRRGAHQRRNEPLSHWQRVSANSGHLISGPKCFCGERAGHLLRRQRDQRTHAGGVEPWAEDTDQFRKSKLACAMACRHALNFPFVAKRHDHFCNFVVGYIDKMTKNSVNLRVDLRGRFHEFFDAGMRATDDQYPSLWGLDDKRHSSPLSQVSRIALRTGKIRAALPSLL